MFAEGKHDYTLAMENDGRHIPPSSGRVGAAARAGLFARSPLITGGMVLIAGASTLKLTGEFAAGTLNDLVRGGFSNAFQLRPHMDVAIGETLFDGVVILGPLLGVCFIAALVPVVLTALAAKRKKGQTAVPLPKRPPSGFARTVFAVFGLGVCGLILLHNFKTAGMSLSALMKGNLDDVGEIAGLLLSALVVSGLIMVLAGLAGFVVDRSTIFKSLHLTRSEARAEARAHEGGKTMASRMRRESGKGA